MNNNTKEKKVSIILPTYNSEKFIIETLDSIKSQTYKNFELIIIDDNSYDDTVSLIRKFIEENKSIDINFIEKTENTGVAVSRNIGIDKSKGRYISFIDSDDLWKEDKIEKQIEFSKKNNYGFIYNSIEIINEKSEVIKTKRKIKKVVNYNTLLKKTVIATSSVFIDMKKIGYFQMPLLRSGQDYATWLILLRNNNAYGISEPLTQYRRSNSSLSSNKFKSIKQVYNIQRKQEKIGIVKASYNTLFFIINAFIKHFL